MPRKLTEDAARKVMLEAGFNPQEPFTHGYMCWKSLCLKCNKISYPRYDFVKNGQKCEHCVKEEKKKETNIAIKDFKNAGFKPLGNYIDTKTPVKCLHICGGICYTNINSIRAGQKYCANCKPNALQKEENVLTGFLAVGVELLGKYISARDPVKAKCLTCGEIYFPVWGVVKQYNHRRCPKCYLIRNKISQEEVVNEFLRAGFELYGTYEQYSIPMECMHIECGKISEKSLQAIRIETGCIHCIDCSYKLDQPSLIYLIENQDLNALKIGVMNSDTQRLYHHKKYGWSFYASWQFETGRQALDFETEILRWMRQDKQLHPSVEPHLMPQNGHTETASLFEISLDEVERHIQQLVGEECLIAC
jgi:predicted GIY-YIG superfamily endonuclease